MAKKRSESVKEKKGNIPAATRGGARNKTNGIAKRSSRPSTTTTYTEVKRGLKSTKVPSQKSQGNRGSCKEKSKQGKHLAISENEMRFVVLTVMRESLDLLDVTCKLTWVT